MPAIVTADGDHFFYNRQKDAHLKKGNTYLKRALSCGDFGVELKSSDAKPGFLNFNMSPIFPAFNSTHLHFTYSKLFG